MRSNRTDRLSVLGSNYFKKAFEQKEKKEQSYSKGKVPIGLTRDGKVFKLDMSDAVRMLILGAAGCLDEKTIVRTSQGPKRMMDLDGDELLCYVDTTTGKKNWSPYVRYKREMKEVYRIILEDGRSVSASADHKFYRNGKLVEVESLSEGDTISVDVSSDKCNFCGSMHSTGNRFCSKKCSASHNSIKGAMASGKVVGKKFSGRTLENIHGKEQADKMKNIARKTCQKRNKENNPMNSSRARKKVSETLRKNGSVAGRNNPAYRHGMMVGQKKNREEYRRIAKENHQWNCTHCGMNGTKMDLVVHHANHDNKDNRPENLVILCQACHARLHFTKWKK